MYFNEINNLMDDHLFRQITELGSKYGYTCFAWDYNFDTLYTTVITENKKEKTYFKFTFEPDMFECLDILKYMEIQMKRAQTKNEYPYSLTTNYKTKS